MRQPRLVNAPPPTASPVSAGASPPARRRRQAAPSRPRRSRQCGRALTPAIAWADPGHTLGAAAWDRRHLTHPAGRARDGASPGRIGRKPSDGPAGAAARPRAACRRGTRRVRAWAGPRRHILDSSSDLTCRCLRAVPGGGGRPRESIDSGRPCRSRRDRCDLGPSCTTGLSGRPRADLPAPRAATAPASQPDSTRLGATTPRTPLPLEDPRIARCAGAKAAFAFWLQDMLAPSPAPSAAALSAAPEPVQRHHPRKKEPP